MSILVQLVGDNSAADAPNRVGAGAGAAGASPRWADGFSDEQRRRRQTPPSPRVNACWPAQPDAPRHAWESRPQSLMEILGVTPWSADPRRPGPPDAAAGAKSVQPRP